MSALPSLVLLSAFLVGVAVGYIGHEVAHWLVLRLGGYDNGLSLWPPQAGVQTPQPVPWAVRVAAVAPALAGLCVAVSGLLVGGVWFVAAMGAASRLCYLSLADLSLARGVVPE